MMMQGSARHTDVCRHFACAKRRSRPLNAPNKLEVMDSERQLTATGTSIPQGWDGTSTDFAITTINVPDRLDVIEVRAREEDEERIAEVRRRRIDWDRILKRSIVAVAVLAAALATYRFAWEPIERDLSAASVSAHLTQSFGKPVSVAKTNFDLFPNPRLVVIGVESSGRWQIGEVSLRMNWVELWNALRAGSWTWAEATVAPLKLGEAQAIALYEDLSRLRMAVPVSISTLRFSEIQLPGNPWLSGRYELVSRRRGTGEFGDPVLTQLDIDGSMRLRLIRQGGEGEPTTVGYSVEASNWKAPFGPSVKWNEATLSGTVQPNLVAVHSFVLSGFYGLTQGTLVAAKGQEWVLTGNAKSTSLDIDSMTRYLATGEPVAPEGAARKSLSGSASFELLVGGKGPTLAQAVASAVVAGPVQVRHGQLNEVNLGLAASRGGVGQGKGGVTRFPEHLSANVVAGSSGTTIRNIYGRAGTMSVRGDLKVAEGNLTGNLLVDLATQRDMKPFPVRVSGTPAAPDFLGN
jgi:hypothetical protein